MPGWFGRRKSSGGGSKAFRYCLPRVEELEARIVPSIFTPAQIRHAYGFDQITFGRQRLPGDGAGQTIAIVEAYHDPSIAADLRYFDRIFGLPDPPKFTQVNQNGGAFFPGVDSLWALETALDVEWAHAIAPRANILLVEAHTGTLGDLLTAVNYARYQSGVVGVAMSWGSSEFWWESSFDGYFTTPAGHVGGSGLRGGISFVASSGDTGAGTCYPAVSPNVLAVGGTSLRIGPWNNSLGESAWSSSGGGISLFEPKPSYQRGLTPGGKRTSPDVAFNSDPDTGYYVYDTVPYAGYAGWFQEGGTSVAAPIWAALIAIADQGRGLNGIGSLANAPAAIYSLPATDFHDITAGSNGYYAAPGYDLVTGRGTPYAKLVVQDLVTFTGVRTITVLPRNAPSKSHLQAKSHLVASHPGVPETGTGSSAIGNVLADLINWDDPGLFKKLAKDSRVVSFSSSAQAEVNRTGAVTQPRVSRDLRDGTSVPSDHLPMPELLDQFCANCKLELDESLPAETFEPFHCERSGIDSHYLTGAWRAFFGFRTRSFFPVNSSTSLTARLK
jgi:subtilase family serine protease